MERTMGFNSTTAAVKALVMEFMATAEEPVERKELVNYINEKMGYNERLTDGVIAGAIKILINNGVLTTVKRGCYQKGTGKEKMSAFEKIFGICERFGNDLDRACTVNLMDLTNKEREIYPRFFEALVEGKGNVDLMVENLRVLIDSIKDDEATELIEDEQVAEPIVDENVESVEGTAENQELVDNVSETENVVDAESVIEAEVEETQPAEEAVVENPVTAETESLTEVVETVPAEEVTEAAPMEEADPVEEAAPVEDRVPAEETVEASEVAETAEADEDKKGSRKKNRRNK